MGEKEGTRLSEDNNYNGKVDYLYLICENHPMISNFTIVFELMEGRPYLVMNSSLMATEKFKLGGIKLFNSFQENIVLPGNSKDWMVFTESASAPHTGGLMYPYQLNTKKAKEGTYSKAHTGVWLSMLVNDKKNCAFSFASIASELWPNNFKWELPVKDDFNKLKVSARSGAIFEREKFGFPQEIPLLPMPFWLVIGKINALQMYYWKLEKLWEKMCEKENRCIFQKQVGVLGIPMIERLLKNHF
ncbi:hypothetical protein ACFQZF_07450 [Flavobacterium myungsuense]|uniref:hypothetical protein n=1 Tax=Flavobacterium myungsuense TaxID=651823 RepID=UPI003632ABE4